MMMGRSENPREEAKEIVRERERDSEIIQWGLGEKDQGK
jgi:hypothetical protein